MVMLFCRRADAAPLRCIFPYIQNKVDAIIDVWREQIIPFDEQQEKPVLRVK